MKSIRQILHSAYSFVRGVESNRSVSALTLDHLIQEQIDAIKGGSTYAIIDAKGETLSNRPSKLSVLDKIQREVDDVVKAVNDAGNDPEKLAQLGLVPDTMDEGTSV